jgi:hypothetical protein
MCELKRVFAGKYLRSCLFKVLGEYIKTWVDNICASVEKSNKRNEDPACFFDIAQFLTKYKDAAYREGRSLEFTFKGEQFHGIPAVFMEKFNSWGDENMTRIYSIISDILYSAQNTWFSKAIEMLDTFELIFIILSNEMDGTLMIINGELEAELKRRH